MRLICPNCGAQYEVPTEVIPETGRDVQCSDCGTTWFQHHPDHPPVELDETPAPSETPGPDATAPEEEMPDYGAEVEEETPEADIPVQEDAAAQTDVKRREIDPAVAEVLREEAEREARAREEDQRGTVETQQELGLQETDGDADRRSEEARARMARLRGLTETPPAEEEAQLDDIDPSSRSNLLPDIDEINSSLDSDQPHEKSAPPVAEAAAAARPRKSGFGSGFRLAVLLAILGLALYIIAPALSETVPALAGPLSGYVEMVNSWRSGLDGLLENFAQSLSGEQS